MRPASRPSGQPCNYTPKYNVAASGKRPASCMRCASTLHHAYAHVSLIFVCIKMSRSAFFRHIICTPQACICAPTRMAVVSNKTALKLFLQSPVSPHMVRVLAATASSVIDCSPQGEQPSPCPSYLPSPPASPLPSPAAEKLPSLEAFISSLVSQSNVQTPTLMSSMIYLLRLKSKLPLNAKGLPCTIHRIFLACLIVAAKNLNDSSPMNKHWAKYTNGLFTVDELNLMERQLLALLDWNLNIETQDLYNCFAPFLDPIKCYLRKEAEKNYIKNHSPRQYSSNYISSRIDSPISYALSPVKSNGSDCSNYLLNVPEATIRSQRHNKRPSLYHSFKSSTSTSDSLSNLPNLSNSPSSLPNGSTPSLPLISNLTNIPTIITQKVKHKNNLHRMESFKQELRALEAEYNLGNFRESRMIY